MRALVLAVALAIGSSAAYGHGDAAWIMDNVQTRFCRGPQDCRVLREGEAKQMGNTWTVNGHTVPRTNVFGTRDGTARYWACFEEPQLIRPRCLFIPDLF